MNVNFFVVIGFLFIVLVLGSAAIASVSAAPWLPVRKKDFSRIRDAFAGREGSFFDLGAGDGRIVRLVADLGKLDCTGFEVSALPLAFAWLLSKKRFNPHARMLAKNFFTVSFADTKNFFCFLTPKAMAKLKEKFEKECAPGTRIVSYSFSIPGWTPTQIDRSGTGIPLYIYDR